MNAKQRRHWVREHIKEAKVKLVAIRFTENSAVTQNFLADVAKALNGELAGVSKVLAVQTIFEWGQK